LIPSCSPIRVHAPGREASRIARSRSSSGYFLGAAMLLPPWLDALHQTRYLTDRSVPGCAAVSVSPPGPGVGDAGPAVDPSPPLPGQAVPTDGPLDADSEGGDVGDEVVAPMVVPCQSCATSWVARGSHWAYRPRYASRGRCTSAATSVTTTAVHTLGHISDWLCQLTAYDLSPVVLRGDDQSIRVVLRRADLETLIDVAITQPRRYGATDPQVMQRLFQLLTELSWHCRTDQQYLIRNQLDRLVATVRAQDFDPHEEAQLKDAAVRVRTAMAGK